MNFFGEYCSDITEEKEEFVKLGEVKRQKSSNQKVPIRYKEL
jgi:hypothetical protein